MATFVRRAPVRVAVDERPDEWVEIKAKLGQADRNRLMDAIMDVSQGADAGGQAKPNIDFHLGEYQMMLLRVGIVGWQIFERDDEEQIVREASGAPKKVPFDQALIDEFNPDDELVDRVLAELAARNPISRQPGPSSTKAG